MDLVPFNKNVCQKRIVYISDLHFDFIKDTKQEHGYRFSSESSGKIQSDFIAYIKENHANDILCLSGDFYNDYSKTVNFAKEMEANQIFGFFVLGNHDYWNNGTLNHEEIVDLFSKETAGHFNFRFLATGKKYYVDDLCFIGDTGWTSFKRTINRFSDTEQIYEIKSFKQFMQLPDAKNVRSFDPKKILQFHNAWIDFANSVLMQEQKVFILTHYPMIDLTKEDIDCWWSSTTQLLDTENQWRIFGHTHDKKRNSNYNITRQRGYINQDPKQTISEMQEDAEEELFNRKVRQDKNRQKWKSDKISRMEKKLKELENRQIFVLNRNKERPLTEIGKEIEKRIRNDINRVRRELNKLNNDDTTIPIRTIEIREEEIQKEIRRVANQYNPDDFGVLHKASDRRELSMPFQNVMTKHYTSAMVIDPDENSKLSRSVKCSGYRRPAANKINFAYLAYNKVEYLKKVRSEIQLWANTGNIRIGYYYFLNMKQETIEALNASTDYLENNDLWQNVRAFITAAVLTGYAWNGEILYIEGMRPINDYDVARFLLQFLTMQMYDIKFEEIRTIERSKKDKIAFGNIDLWLPTVNGKQLTIEQVMTTFRPTPLIEHINPNRIYKVACQSCGYEFERYREDTMIGCAIKNCIHCGEKDSSAT